MVLVLVRGWGWGWGFWEVRVRVRWGLREEVVEVGLPLGRERVLVADDDEGGLGPSTMMTSSSVAVVSPSMRFI